MADNYPRPPALALSLLAGLALVAGSCASPTERSAEPPTETTSLEPGIYAVDSGERLSRERLYGRLAEADYVVVGESHTTEWHHTIQRDILEAMLDRREGRIALGMEMFEQPYQDALDRYIAGEYDEQTMLEETNWADSWGMAPSLYRPLWTTARKHGAPLAALNVSRLVTRTIARKGLEGLSDEQRARLPDEIDTSFEAQRRYLQQVFAGHGGHAEGMKFEYFLQAQATWDETMAEAAVEFVHGRTEVDGMVIATGRVHARKSFGIPPRVRRRLDAEESGGVVSVLPYDPGEKTLEGSITMEQLRAHDVADYVWIRNGQSVGHGSSKDG